MLKKAGLVVAASAASLLAVSPLAFAGDKGDAGHHHGGLHSANVIDKSSEAGLVSGLNGNNVNVPIQACGDDVHGQVGLVPIQDIAEDPTASLTGALGILGEGKAKSKTNTVNNRGCGDNSGSAGDAVVGGK